MSPLFREESCERPCEWRRNKGLKAKPKRRVTSLFDSFWQVEVNTSAELAYSRNVMPLGLNNVADESPASSKVPSTRRFSSRTPSPIWPISRRSPCGNWHGHVSIRIRFTHSDARRCDNECRGVSGGTRNKFDTPGTSSSSPGREGRTR